MQTFLPYPSFVQTAKCLDFRRLGKQRVEAATIFKTIRGESLGWKHHPVVRMWTGYEDALSNYLLIMIDEWILRGYKNNMVRPKEVDFPTLPPWIGNESLHASHRSNLLRKYPEWYSRFGWEEPDNLPYVWI